MNQQVIQTLRKFGREKQSGVLTCQGVELARRMIFLEGKLVGARSSSKAERLGEVMVRHGHITEQHLNDATIFARKGRRLGEVLAELQIIKTGDIETYVRLQVLEICSSVILEPPKKMKFAKMSKPPSDLATSVNVLDTIMEAARRTPRINQHIKALVGDNRHLSLSDDSMKLMERITLLPHEAFILSRVNGSEPAHSVFALSPLSEEQTARAVLGHLYVGILELKEDPNKYGLVLKD